MVGGQLVEVKVVGDRTEPRQTKVYTDIDIEIMHL